MGSKVSGSVSPSGLMVYNEKEFRIVMVGKTGAGKSATGNTILGREVFESRFTPKSQTLHCNKKQGDVDGQTFSLIDTPGLFDTRITKTENLQEVAQSVMYAAPGPHVFLIVIKLDRFTEEEKQTVQNIQKVFGAEAPRYSMVLFTHGDLLKGQSIEDFLKESKELQELVAKCNHQYHVFNNDLKDDRSQVRELLQKIRKIREKNGGHHYTTEMFQTAERKIQEEAQRILKEAEEKMLKEQEEQKKKIEAKYKEQMKKMAADSAKQKQLIEAQQREIKLKQEEIRRQQEKESRRQAEKSGGVLGIITMLVQAAVKLYLETRR